MEFNEELIVDGLVEAHAAIARLTAENERLVAESISDLKSFEEQLADCRNAIARLDSDNERLHEEVADEHARGEQLAAELNTFRQAVEHVTDPEHPTRSFTASEGWTMIANSRHTDLLVAEEKMAEAREAARWLCGNAIFGVNKEAAERWPWLLEDAQ